VHCTGHVAKISVHAAELAFKDKGLASTSRCTYPTLALETYCECPRNSPNAKFVPNPRRSAKWIQSSP
jgi:hypothetical protein